MMNASMAQRAIRQAAQSKGRRRLSSALALVCYSEVMRILFVRHGKSIANATGMIGVPDTPLAEEGLEQARLTGQDLRAQNVTHIVCSPFLRAQQTAEIIAGEVGVPLHEISIIDELHERRMGGLEGKPKAHETEFFYKNDTDFGFESQVDLIARLQIALAKIRAIAEATDGAVVVVGHAASGFYLRQVAKGRTSYSDFDPYNQMDNAEFVELSTE